MNFPYKGRSKDEVLSILKKKRESDTDWSDGRVFAYLYDVDQETRDLIKEASSLYLLDNALDPTFTPSIVEMENDIISMAINLLHGSNAAEGSLTSGGTESIMLMIKSVRDYHRVKNPHIKQPEIILPSTVHPAFHKGCAYFDLKAIVVDVEPLTFLPDVKKIEEAITDSTVLMVGSAPSYAHGIIDPIEDMAAISQKHNIFFHVDACVGGFYLPFLEKVGKLDKHFDFRVPGVTSISLDIHKFGYAAKGASIILYADHRLRRHQIFTCAKYPGYVLINQCITSSKSGGPVASAWATINYIGEDGYKAHALKTYKATQRFIKGIENMDDLYILGQPDMTMLAIASRTIDIFKLNEALQSKGWVLQIQFSSGNSPENLHITFYPNNVQHVDALLSDIKECVEIIKSNPQEESFEISEDLIEMIENITPESFQQLAQLFNGGNEKIPKDMYLINKMLNKISPEGREKVVLEFMSNIYDGHQ